MVTSEIPVSKSALGIIFIISIIYIYQYYGAVSQENVIYLHTGRDEGGIERNER